VRASVGFVTVHLALLVAGWGVIHALGLVSLRPVRLAASSGLAYLAGVATVLPICIALLTLGVRVDLPIAAAVTLAVGVTAFGFALLRREGSMEGRHHRLRSESGGWEVRQVIVRAGLMLLVGFLAFGALSFRHLPLISDDAHIFSLRALGLFFRGRLIPEVFTNPTLVRSHLDYPLLQPLLESLVYRAMARADVALIHVEPWIVFASMVGASCYLLAGVRRCALWLPGLAALAVAPGVYVQAAAGGADVPESCFLGLGALSGGLWLESRRPAYAALTGLMLGAAANTKNEGLGGALVLLVVLGLVAGVWRSRDNLLGWLPVVGLTVASLLPWRLWLASNGISNADLTPLRTALTPAFLWDHLDRVPFAAGRMLEQLGNQGRWVWLFPLMLVVGLVALLRAGRRPLAAFYILAVAGVGAPVLFAYWITALPIGYHLDTSVERTVTGILFVCAVGIAHLLASLGDDLADRDAPTRSSR
jgi:hypothetical protein